jgi:hypothetical protein
MPAPDGAEHRAMGRYFAIGTAVAAGSAGIVLVAVLAGPGPLPNPNPSRVLAVSHFLYLAAAGVIVGGLDLGVLAAVRHRARASARAPDKAEGSAG